MRSYRACQRGELEWCRAWFQACRTLACRKLLGPMCWAPLKELHFLSKLCPIFEPCFSFRRISLPGQSDFLVPTDSAMNFNQPLLGLCIVLTCNLLGCEDGVVYSSLSDAVSALCDGSSCPVSCKCCLEKRYARADECISAFVWYGWVTHDRIRQKTTNGVQNCPISVTSVYFRELETVEIPSKIAFHPDMVLFLLFRLLVSPEGKLNVVVCFPRGWKL